MHRRWLRNWSATRDDVRFSFKCTECGRCCTGKGGQVRVNEREVQAIAAFKNASVDDIKQQSTTNIATDGFFTLKQTPDDRQCVFLEDNKCSIYTVRPTQCRTFPWWPQNLLSDYDWQRTAKQCEGIALESDDDATSMAFEDVLPEAILQDVHRSGENYTYEELKSMLSDLAAVDPSFVDGYKQEFVAQNHRTIVYQDEAVAVMDTVLQDSEQRPTRCFVFQDRLELIQSAMYLRDDSVDPSSLVLDVHQALAMAALMVPQTKRVCVVGAGAGALPMFLLHHLRPMEQLDAIEPSAIVNQIGREWFYTTHKNTQRFQVHETKGEAFFAASSGDKPYDLLMVDVESGQDATETGVRAPPASMLTTAFLQNLHDHHLATYGIVAINVITTSQEALDHVQTQLRHVFTGKMVKMELPTNTVFLLWHSTNTNDTKPPTIPTHHQLLRHIQNVVSTCKITRYGALTQC